MICWQVSERPGSTAHVQVLSEGVNAFPKMPCAHCAHLGLVECVEMFPREKRQISDSDDTIFFFCARVHAQVLNVHMTPNLLHLNTSSAVSPPLFPFGDFGAGIEGEDSNPHRKSAEH